MSHPGVIDAKSLFLNRCSQLGQHWKCVKISLNSKLLHLNERRACILICYAMFKISVIHIFKHILYISIGEKAFFPSRPQFSTVKCQSSFTQTQQHHGNTGWWEPATSGDNTLTDLQTSGSSSEPSGQSFSRSQRQPLEMHVTPSLHTNCFELQVFGAERRQRQ